MNRIGKILAMLCISILAFACKVSYSFTGASIAPEVKTFSVQQFLNIAPMTVPTLSSTLTDELVERFSRQTSLAPVRVNGDFAFEGTITNYTTTPMAVTADEYASQNRLSITVQVIFVNKFDPKANFTTSFTRYADYDSSVSLQAAEGALIPEIVKQLVTDIFNASASNW